MRDPYDVEIRREVDIARLGWPEPGAAGADGMDSGFGGNRAYIDLRTFRWEEARRVLEKEQTLIARIKASDDPEVEYDEVTDELYEDDEGLYGLDLGVAAAVVALSASRCIPFSSCNGGAFGGGHFELYPLVAFYARPAHLEALIASAEEGRCGIENGNNGCLLVFSGDIEALPNFAAALVKRSSAFRLLKLKSPPIPKISDPAILDQLRLL